MPGIPHTSIRKDSEVSPDPWSKRFGFSLHPKHHTLPPWLPGTSGRLGIFRVR